MVRRLDLFCRIQEAVGGLWAIGLRRGLAHMYLSPPTAILRDSRGGDFSFFSELAGSL